MADHVPVDLPPQGWVIRMLLHELGHLGRDLFQLLHPVLAQVTVAEPDYLLDLLEIRGLCHDDEPNVLPLPMGPGTSLRDRSLNTLDSVTDFRRFHA
jgi:hypothetical protein